MFCPLRLVTDVALQAAKERVKPTGSRAAKPKPRAREVRRDGREPVGLGAAIGALVTRPGLGAPDRRWHGAGPVVARILTRWLRD